MSADGRSGNGRRSVAVIGGGFGGIAAAVMLRRAGYDDVTVFERGERIGGVWHRNTYPGAACDIPSHYYEYSFEPNPGWSRRYAPQAEIRAYIEDVAKRHQVLDRIRTGTEVTRARWDDTRDCWTLETTAGEYEADVLIAACGQLTVPKLPQIPGLERFEGPAFHTAEWRHDVELSGRRVAVVGTGCSAIQVVPEIQPIVEGIDVYQRSPGWTFPKMDFAYSERAKRLFERFPLIQRLDRALAVAFGELGAAAMTKHRWLLPALRAVGRRQINGVIEDPELRRKVTPTDEIGCKRIMLTDHWYPTLAKSNVELVSDRITEVTPNGIRTADGTHRPADVLVLATGFQSHNFVAPLEIVGVGGRTLAEEWAEVPRAYLGLSVPGFPNMFLLFGPNTSTGSGSAVATIEAGMSHVIAALQQLDRAEARRIEVRRQAAETFDRELRTALARSVWATGCSSWFLDEKGNNPSQWPWQLSAYRRRAERLDPAAYELSPAGSERTAAPELSATSRQRRAKGAT